MGRHYVIFSALYLPNLGGVERFTYNLAKKLLARGDQVTVVTSNVQGIQEYEKTEGIEDVYKRQAQVYFPCGKDPVFLCQYVILPDRHCDHHGDYPEYAVALDAGIVPDSADLRFGIRHRVGADSGGDQCVFPGCGTFIFRLADRLDVFDPHYLYHRYVAGKPALAHENQSLVSLCHLFPDAGYGWKCSSAHAGVAISRPHLPGVFPFVPGAGVDCL